VLFVLGNDDLSSGEALCEKILECVLREDEILADHLIADCSDNAFNMVSIKGHNFTKKGKGLANQSKEHTEHLFMHVMYAIVLIELLKTLLKKFQLISSNSLKESVCISPQGKE